MTEHIIEISRSVEPFDGEPNDGQAAAWLESALNKLVKERMELSLRIVSEHEMTALNSDYRNHHSPTNVLSFPSGVRTEECCFLGDIVVCTDVILKEAQEFEKSFAERYAHMLIHGLLHLLGYDHVDARQREAMESLEKTLLISFGIDNPYEMLNGSRQVVQ
tara:strand:+ start:1112 stop:1597 length:486 start_codon:yes stop_codon:yes gene_type:complete